MCNEKENGKDIEIISGDEADLEISPVYEHIKKPKTQDEKPKNIVMPRIKKKK